VSIASLFGKLDDWLNPIVVKELRQAVRSRVVVAALMLFLLVQLGLFGVYALTTAASRQHESEVFSAGRQIFRVLQGILLGTCLLVPAYAGLRLGAERSDTNVDLLFISTLRPRAIVSGKLLSAVVLVLLAFSACAPFMTFSYLLRGLDMSTVLLVLYVDFMVALWAIQVALFLAVVPAPPAVRGVFILVGLGGLIALFSQTWGWTGELIRSGLGTFADSWEFWIPLLSLTLLELGLIGLLFVWSVAILSPPSANRALPVRLYLLLFWMATGLAAGYWSFRINNYGPLGSWAILNGLVFALHIVISINEREQWAPRMARAIPRRVWLRLPAFVFYSGAAGGLLLALFMLELTFWVGLLALEHFTAWEAGRATVNDLKFVLLVGIYAYCYGLSGVLVRITLLRGHLRPINTWLVALLLVGLGSILPYMIAYFFYPETLRYSALEQGPWNVTNPFASIDEAMQRSSRSYGALDYYSPMYRPRAADVFDAPCLPFLAIWAGVVTVLCVPWAVGQAARFRPLQRDHDADEARAVAVEPLAEGPSQASPPPLAPKVSESQ